MKKITSFTVNHIKLLRGIYVSRKDSVGNEIITTFDIRMKKPNTEPVINTAELHTIEHLGATFLRNHEIYGKKIIYFGPMGCRTGFYLVIHGDFSSENILPLIKEMFEFISNFEGNIPGASAIECGNYLDMNLPMAKYEARKFLEEILNNIKQENLYYPK
ncbi:S-ribosylhomocysteine lyase [Defluviitalea phaphyphila]|uniref:S-ribosylhomocysteine lyase n=1 Tax=Defluviitalea phaphyphila TaxID=1473580 RepID=UPI0007310D40|nr:S-ribosylhomocysteine lyase [Defluviitalea phaphyphila]